MSAGRRLSTDDVDHVLTVDRARVLPGSWILIRYIEDGWFPAKLSTDTKSVIIERDTYTFDATEDEFVEYSSLASNFLQLHPNSVMVRLDDKDYLVADPKRSVGSTINALNVLRRRSNLSLLPPLDEQYEGFSVEEAATLCTPGILTLHVT
jgi:hypothetical protein